MCWVYEENSDGGWNVGFYDPDGGWHRDSEWTYQEHAARRTMAMNGGSLFNPEIADAEEG